jgi:hypothetical protein
MTMMTTPDLGKPYSSEAERGADVEALLLCQYGIDGLITLAGRDASQWSQEQESCFPRVDGSGRVEHPRDRLRRWVTIFETEITLVHAVRGRLVRGALVSDAELMGAAYLALWILAAALDVPPPAAAAQVHALSAYAAGYRWPEPEGARS